MTNDSRNSFQLDAVEMKKIGYHAIDILVEHLTNLKDKPVMQNHHQLIDINNEHIPLSGENWDAIMDQLNNIVLSNIVHLNHPRCFSFIPSPGNYISAIAELITNGFNIFSGNWFLGEGAAHIETITLNWLKEIFGLSPGSGGLFVSGGSMANLTALMVAKHTILQNKIDKAVIYCSDQTHSSIERAVKILGFHSEQLCKIPCNALFQISTSKLIEQIQLDISIGRVPFCIVANLGTTNTGAIDPIKDLLDIASRYGNMWIHGDGAFGAPAILAKPEMFQGVKELDSLSFDPHKWFFQSYDIGCLLVKNEKLLKDCFFVLPEYLKDAETKNNEINFSDYGIELTRRFRALKLWMTIKMFGLHTFKESIKKSISLVEEAENWVHHSLFLENISYGIGIITFRFVSQEKQHSDLELNYINEKIVTILNHSGFAMVSTTTLHEKTVIRLCPLHPSVTLDDVINTLKKLEQYGVELSKKMEVGLC